MLGNPQSQLRGMWQQTLPPSRLARPQPGSPPGAGGAQRGLAEGESKETQEARNAPHPRGREGLSHAAGSVPGLRGSPPWQAVQGPLHTRVLGVEAPSPWWEGQQETSWLTAHVSPSRWLSPDGLSRDSAGDSTARRKTSHTQGWQWPPLLQVGTLRCREGQQLLTVTQESGWVGLGARGQGVTVGLNRVTVFLMVQSVFSGIPEAVPPPQAGAPVGGRGESRHCQGPGTRAALALPSWLRAGG